VRTNFQNYWVFTLLLSSSVLDIRKHYVSELDLFPFSGELEGGNTYFLLLGKYARTSLNIHAGFKYSSKSSGEVIQDQFYYRIKYLNINAVYFKSCFVRLNSNRV
jgi:hypothetical protein